MVIKGTYIRNQCGQFKNDRPKFYAEVERQTGVKLERGTLNIRCVPEDFVEIPEPSIRIEGVDDIDIEHNQYLLIGVCWISGIQGYQILPMEKPNSRRGHHAEGIIEVSLEKKLDDLRDGEELEVTFPES
jgi:CTP-dependent riboflavin kinase